VARQHVAIPAVDKKIVDGRIADETTAQLLGAALGDLLTELALVGPARR
jgi:hypothetical protein